MIKKNENNNKDDRQKMSPSALIIKVYKEVKKKKKRGKKIKKINNTQGWDGNVKNYHPSIRCDPLIKPS